MHLLTLMILIIVYELWSPFYVYSFIIISDSKGKSWKKRASCLKYKNIALKYGLKWVHLNTRRQLDRRSVPPPRQDS